MNWLDREDTDDDLRDVSARDIVPPKDVSLVDIEVGNECDVLYEGRLYKARVLAIGKQSGVTRFFIRWGCSV